MAVAGIGCRSVVIVGSFCSVLSRVWRAWSSGVFDSCFVVIGECEFWCGWRVRLHGG